MASFLPDRKQLQITNSLQHLSWGGLPVIRAGEPSVTRERGGSSAQLAGVPAMIGLLAQGSRAARHRKINRNRFFRLTTYPHSLRRTYSLSHGCISVGA